MAEVPQEVLGGVVLVMPWEGKESCMAGLARKEQEEEAANFGQFESRKHLPQFGQLGDGQT
jgi:hypothetical protein